MSHLLYLMFRCDFDVMESLENSWEVNTAVVCRFVSQMCKSDAFRVYLKIFKPGGKPAARKQSEMHSLVD